MRSLWNSSRPAKQDDFITIVNTSEYTHYIRPPADRESIREDFVFTGYVEVKLTEGKRAQYIKVMAVCEARLMYPGKPPEKLVLFENAMLFKGSDCSWIEIDAGSQIFEYAFVLPSTLAGFERNPYGRIEHRILATVVGQVAGPDMIEAQSQEQSGCQFFKPVPTLSEYKGPAFVTRAACDNNWDRTILSRQNSKGPLQESFTSREESTSLISSASRNKDLPWLIGDLLAHQHIYVIPLPTEDRQALPFHWRTTDHLPGLGSLRWTIESHAITVGGTIFFRSAILDPSSKATVWCIRLVIGQKYRLSSPNKPEEEPITALAAPLLLYEKGKLHTNNVEWYESKGIHGHGPLWDGDLVPGPASRKDRDVLNIAEGFKLPDENQLRPSTCQGTITPIRVSHEFALHIFYSVWGEDISGKPLPKEGPGQIRKAVLRTNVMISSCACTMKSLGLPTYDEPSPSDKLVETVHELCACRQPMEDVSGWALREEEEGNTTTGPIQKHEYHPVVR